MNKFKVWSIIDDKFLKNRHLIDEQGDLYMGLVGGRVLLYDNQENYKVLRSTGLKDKEGKEIFESDILEFPNEEESKGKVHFIHIDNTVEARGPNCYIEAKSFSDCKIIGNIYEDSNLLTKQN